MGGGIIYSTDKSLIVGFGPLARALLAAELSVAGLEVHVATRITGSDHAEDQRRMAERGAILRRVHDVVASTPIASINDTNSPEGREAIVAHIIDPTTVAIVICVRDGFAAVRPLLELGLDGRLEAGGPPILVILAENLAPAGFDDFARRYTGTNVHVLLSAVDRISRPDHEHGGVCDVWTEPYGSWTIAADPERRAAAIFAANPNVRIVPDALPYLRAKIVTVNGVEFAAAVCAKYAGKIAIESILSEPVAREFVERAACELALAAHLRDPETISLQSATTDALRAVNRFARMGGLFANAFGGWNYLAEGMPGFMQKLQERLSNPLSELILSEMDNGTLTWVHETIQRAIDGARRSTD